MSYKRQCKYVYQFIIILKSTRFFMKKDAGWGGSASFSGNSFDPFIDSAVMIVSRVQRALSTLI